jgi:hypothetical protein
MSDLVLNKYKSFKQRIKDMFYLIMIFSAFSFKGTIAVLQAVFKKRTPFTRTPKKGNEQKRYVKRDRNYVEITGFLYYLLAIPILVKLKLWGLLPWILLFVISSLYFVYLSLSDLKG